MVRLKKILYKILFGFIAMLVGVVLIGMREKFTLEEAQQLATHLDCNALRNEAIEVIAQTKTTQGSSHELMRSIPLPKNQWPTSVRSLNPKNVSIDKEGLWITKSGFFVEEEGLFVPANNSQEYKEKQDPYFELICPQVYYFWFTG